MTAETNFTLEAAPTPASRPKIGRGFAYYPAKHTAYANWLKEYLKQVPPFQTEGPVEVRLLFVMPRYKTVTSTIHKADLDNLSKMPMDSMTKSRVGDEEDAPRRFWKDDHEVVHLTALKRFTRDGEDPHTRVKIRTIEDNIEDYADRIFHQ